MELASEPQSWIKSMNLNHLEGYVPGALRRPSRSHLTKQYCQLGVRGQLAQAAPGVRAQLGQGSGASWGQGPWVSHHEAREKPSLGRR